jgi:hypothetical protein
MFLSEVEDQRRLPRAPLILRGDSTDLPKLLKWYGRLRNVGFDIHLQH